MTASIADDEIWHVLVAADDMKRMNLDQLADAFRLSLVDASTMVWKGGMQNWRRLGSVADLEDDEPETIARPLAPPPPPRPLGRPLPRPPSPPRPPSRAPGPQPMRLHSHDVYAAPLVAPVYAPAHAPAAPRVPAAFAQTQRRSAMPSEVDFRRRSGGVRWGRWLIALVLVTGGVLGAYRQNLLREGARRVGLENKYLYAEKRVTTLVTAKAPPEVTALLTRAALLPGPNYVAPAPAPAAATPPPARAALPPAPETSATPAPSAEKPRESDVKTVSLDSLPLLGNEATTTSAAPTPAAAPHQRAALVTKTSTPIVTAHQSTRVSEPAAKPEPKKAEPKPEPKKAEPKPEPKKAEPKKAQPQLAAPQANDNPLKAAIRMAIAADASKSK